MTEFSTRQLVAHSPAQMFALVADIEAYPQFVPLCHDLKIIERQCLDDGGGEILIADMTMAYKLFRETFRSRVTLTPGSPTYPEGLSPAGLSPTGLSQDGPSPKILVEYLDGPFSHLENRWVFHPDKNGGDNGATTSGSDVEFYIAYEFRSRAVQMMVGPVFEKVFSRFIDAFEARANMLYG